MSSLAHTTSERYLRQQDHISEQMQKTGITIIGAGAVGSFTALSLAKMGFGKLMIFDHDTIEEHNISNQFYRLADIGRPKVEALKSAINAFEHIPIQIFPEKYDSQRILPGIVISALDSIEARAAIWKNLKYKGGMELYIDSRMSLEQFSVITVDPLFSEDKKRYEETLDPDTVEERCTARTVLYTVLAISSVICSIVTRHVRGEDYPKHLAVDMVTLQMLELKSKEDA